MAKDKVSTYFKNQPSPIKCTKCVHKLKRKFWNAHARVKLINMPNIYIYIYLYKIHILYKIQYCST